MGRGKSDWELEKGVPLKDGGGKGGAGQKGVGKRTRRNGALQWKEGGGRRDGGQDRPMRAEERRGGGHG